MKIAQRLKAGDGKTKSDPRALKRWAIFSDFIIHGRMNHRSVLLLVIFFVFAGPDSSHGQETSTPPPSPAVSETVELTDPAAATQAWLATLPCGNRDKFDSYFDGGYWLILLKILFGAA